MEAINTPKRGRPRKYFSDEERREGRRLRQLERRRKQKEISKSVSNSDEEHSKE